jgi:glucokinase
MHFGEHVTAEGVYDLARQGNQRAILIFKSVGRALGIALGNMINVFNFPLYLLTGGPLPAWDMFAPAMFEEIKSRSLTFARTNTRVEKAVLGSDAGLYGAAYLPLQSSSVLEVAAVGR